MQPPLSLDLEAIKGTVQELYGQGLRKADRPKFYMPYLEIIDRENPYPMGYRIPDFSLFSREYG